MSIKKRTYLTPLALAGCLMVGLFLGRKITPIDSSSLTTDNYGGSDYRKMQDIIKIIDNKYVDTVNGSQLFEDAIGDMLHKLDPHSNYIPAKDLLASNEQIKGEFAGVGIRFFIIRDTVCVTNVVAGSPSERAGLHAGDKILKVDKQNIAKTKIQNDKVMSLLKGPVGTKVVLQILRNSNKIEKLVIRGEIPIHSVVASYMLNKNTGFIKIESFSMTTTKEFRSAAKKLLDAGMTRLVLDLRNNGGGVLRSATDIADDFLTAGKVIVSTKGSHSKEQRYLSTNVGMLEKIKVAVLINESSASASEILAGALQDNDRALIIGRRSFGKGLVQEDVQLRDGSNLRLTIARYYTPTGRCIQKEFNGDIDDYYNEQSNRYTNGELYAPDSTVFVDSLKFYTKGGRVVYGGGGIMPDVFVPLDTSGSSWYLSQLRYIASFQTFAFDYVSGKRNNWKSPADFSKNFIVTDQIVSSFVNYCKDNFDVPINQKDLATSKSLIKELLKAEIARQIWTEDGYFFMVNAKDKEINMALKRL